jgi:hypothetical protein
MKIRMIERFCKMLEGTVQDIDEGPARQLIAEGYAVEFRDDEPKIEKAQATPQAERRIVE